ncbi:putative motility protein [Thermodesulfobacteriota bacterium]
MTITPPGRSMITSIAAQATVLKEAQLQSEVNVALLSDALETHEDLVSALLQSLGIGQNVDIVV